MLANSISTNKKLTLGNGVNQRWLTNVEARFVSFNQSDPGFKSYLADVNLGM